MAQPSNTVYRAVQAGSLKDHMMDWEIWLTATFQVHKKKGKDKNPAWFLLNTYPIYNHTFENSLSQGVASWETAMFKKP